METAPSDFIDRPYLTWTTEEHEILFHFSWTGIKPDPIEVRLELNAEPKESIPTVDFPDGAAFPLSYWMGWFQGVCRDYLGKTFKSVTDEAVKELLNEEEGDNQ